MSMKHSIKKRNKAMYKQPYQVWMRQPSWRKKVPIAQWVIQNHPCLSSPSESRALSHQPLFKRMHYRFACRPELWRNFFNWESSVPNDSRMCQVDIKLNSVLSFVSRHSVELLWLLEKSCVSSGKKEKHKNLWNAPVVFPHGNRHPVTTP